VELLNNPIDRAWHILKAGRCMMKTPNGLCGAPTEEGQKFCPYCNDYNERMKRLSMGNF